MCARKCVRCSHTNRIIFNYLFGGISASEGRQSFESIWLLQLELEEKICRNGSIGTENLKFRFLLEPLGGRCEQI